MVTLHSHRHPSSPGWAKRVGPTRLRRSDMPLVGVLALLVATVLARLGHRGSAAVAAGLAVGATTGALGTGILDPLPVRGLPG